MSLVLLGAKGSMGRRYLAILRHLGVPCHAVDRDEFTLEAVAAMLRSSEGAIIATPTDTHLALCALVAAEAPGVPILCEKPLSCRSPVEVEAILSLPSPVTMMCQYVLLDDGGDGPTLYDYYDSGKDGLLWDAIQLVGLARGPIDLRTDSPIWRCELNGRRLALEQVHQAYVDFVAGWLKGERGQAAAWLTEVHRRVFRAVPPRPQAGNAVAFSVGTISAEMDV